MIRSSHRNAAIQATAMLGLACALRVAAAAAAEAGGTSGRSGGRTGHPISIPNLFQKHNETAQQAATGANDFIGDIFRDYNKAYDDYEAFKNRLETNDNLSLSLLSSYFLQSATPYGGPPVSLFVYAPSVTWTPFNSDTWGSGQINVSFIQNQYWSVTTNGAQQARIGVITPPNDWTSNGYNWSQVSYTHTLPDAMSWLSITAGQFSIGSFDGNLYAGDAQSNFVTYALAQNATQTYPDAGLGFYLSATVPNTTMTLNAGFQGATDVNGQTISTRGFQTGTYAWFGNAVWDPDVVGLGKGSYNILVYHQPSVPMQPGQSTGVSFSMSQALNKKFGIFARANYASGSVLEITSSFAAGGVIHNPFGHNSHDHLGLGWFMDRANSSGIGETAPRLWEYGPEVYYSYTLLKGLEITPDAAAILNPVLAPNHGVAYIFTLRLTSRL